jgi:DNA-binding CsgD family transcriptional regulator
MSSNRFDREYDDDRSPSGAQLVGRPLGLQLSQLSGLNCLGEAACVEVKTVVNRSATLSAGEQRVVNLVKAGKSNKAIAIELSISRRTVEAHLTRVFRKFEIASRLELALLE